MSKKHSRQRAEELLQRVGLADRMRHRPGDMSGGQQQRVAVARAIALDPLLILADEPTAHLDYIQVEEVLTLIRELASGERVVVVATHDTRMLPLAGHRRGTHTPDHLHRTRTGGIDARRRRSRVRAGQHGRFDLRGGGGQKSSSCANWPAAVKKRSQPSGPATISARWVRSSAFPIGDRPGYRPP